MLNATQNPAKLSRAVIICGERQRAKGENDKNRVQGTQIYTLVRPRKLYRSAQLAQKANHQRNETPVVRFFRYIGVFG